MRKTVRVGVSIGLMLMLGLILYLNYALYYQPDLSYGDKTVVNADLLAQLRYLKQEIHDGAADDMQAMYPEGFVFLNALYGLTWIELASGMPKDSDLFQEALQETNWAIKEINSSKGKSPFAEELDLPYGAFYNGWLTYLVGKRLSLQSIEEGNDTQVALFQSNCTKIASVLAETQSPFLASYPGLAWPADGVICVASLAIHDQLFEPQYQGLLKEWVTEVKQREDMLGLIPHQCKPFTGSVLAPARGASQSLMLAFLPEIDSGYARQKFAMYKKYFLAYRLGLPAIREYAQGSQGQEDIDSGPILFDAGGAASIVGRRTMQQYGKMDLLWLCEIVLKRLVCLLRKKVARCI